MVHTIAKRPELPQDEARVPISALNPAFDYQATEGLQTAEEIVINPAGGASVIRVYAQGGVARIAFSTHEGESPAPVGTGSMPIAPDTAEYFSFLGKRSIWFITENSGTTVTLNVSVMR